PLQAVAPARRVMTVLAIQKTGSALMVPQRGADFRAQSAGLLHSPDRRDAGAGPEDVALWAEVRRGSMAQAVQQQFIVRGVEDRHQGVGPAQPPGILGTGQQVQVVIAQHSDEGDAETFEKSQRLEGVGSAVDQIADRPQGIPRRVEVDLAQQALQRLQAALNVTDCIDSHTLSPQWSALGLAR